MTSSPAGAGAAASAPEQGGAGDRAGGPLRRLWLLVAYDGAPFSGFARQQGRRTVQGELEGALARLAGGPVRSVAAGRTDAGVHARGQVVHADVPPRLDPPRVHATLNALLGPAIAVRAAGWAPPGFDARRSALRRRYRYRIDDRPVPDPLQRGHVLHWRRPLALERMRAAAVALVGERDFASFCKAAEGGTTVRRLRAVTIWRRDGLVHVELVADAFCHQMVRSIVGFLLQVGDGRRDPAVAPAVLAARDRGRAGLLAPPHGLVLESVTYPDPPRGLEGEPDPDAPGR